MPGADDRDKSQAPCGSWSARSAPARGSSAARYWRRRALSRL